MKFDSDFIEKVRESNSLVEAVSRYTNLKGVGNRFTGLCPFPGHNEKTPSFSVSEAQQLYHCFGCKKSGNIFHFVQEMQGFGFVEALEHLAAKAGLELPKGSYSNEKSNPSKGRQNSYKKILAAANQFYHNTLMKLPETHPVWVYCKSREITPEVAKEFQLGFAPDSWDALLNYFTRQGVSTKLLSGLGLAKQRKTGEGFYDQYRNRLIFPIMTLSEDVVGFGGRVLDDSMPKYINSSESDIFKKSQIFYGLNLSARHIREKDYAIVVEGYMDFLALYTAGIKNVVATLGTALTEKHARLLRRYTSKVVLLFDGDNAGQQAAFKSAPTLLSAELLPKSTILPNGMDPDDYLKKFGIKSFQEQLAQSKDLFLIIFEEKLKSYGGSSTEKVDLVEAMAPIFKSIQNRPLKELYAQEVCFRLNVQLGWLSRALGGKSSSAGGESPALQRQNPEANLEGPKPIAEESKIERVLIDLQKAPRHEVELLTLSLKSEQLQKLVQESEVIKQISDQNISKLLQTIDQVYRQSPSEFDKLTALLANQVHPASLNLLSGYLHEPLSLMDESASLKYLKDCIAKVEEIDRKTKIRKLIHEFKQGSVSDEKLERFMNIKTGKVEENL